MRRQPAPQTQQNLENVHLSTEHQGLSTRDFTTPRICLPYAHVTPNVTPQGLCCPGGRRWQQASPMPRTAPVCEASKTPRETCRCASPSPPLQPPPGAGTCQGGGCSRLSSMQLGFMQTGADVTSGTILRAQIRHEYPM